MRGGCFLRRKSTGKGDDKGDDKGNDKGKGKSKGKGTPKSSREDAKGAKAREEELKERKRQYKQWGAQVWG